VCGVAAASRNTRFQAARYGLTWVGLTPTDRASFAWRLPSFDLIRYRRHDDSSFLYAFDLIECWFSQLFLCALLDPDGAAGD